MIVAMLEHASEDQIQRVTDHLMRMGFAVHRTTGARQSVLAAVGKRIDFDTRDLEVLPGVERVHRISAPYKLAGRQFHEHDTIVKLPNGTEIGGSRAKLLQAKLQNGIEVREDDQSGVRLLSELFRYLEDTVQVGPMLQRSLAGALDDRAVRHGIAERHA